MYCCAVLLAAGLLYYYLSCFSSTSAVLSSAVLYIRGVLVHVAAKPNSSVRGVLRVWLLVSIKNVCAVLALCCAGCSLLLLLLVRKAHLVRCAVGCPASIVEQSSLSLFIA